GGSGAGLRAWRSQSTIAGSGVVTRSAWSNTFDGARVHSESRTAIALVDARSSRRPAIGIRLPPNTQPSNANAASRHANSRFLRRERIDDQVHGEPRVVDRQKAFAL